MAKKSPAKKTPAKKEAKKVAAPAQKKTPAKAPAKKVEEKAAPEIVYTVPNIAKMKPDDVKKLLVGAAVDMNQTLGLKPPINVKGDVESIKEAILANAVDVVEEDELLTETWMALYALDAKLGFDTSGLVEDGDDNPEGDGVVGASDEDEEDEEDEDEESSDDTDEDEEDEDEDED